MFNYSQSTFSEAITIASLQGQHSICTSDSEETGCLQYPDSSPTATNGHATQSRVLEFSTLKDGWYDDEIESKRPTGLSISRALRILDVIPRLLEIVSVYPMYEGGILFEFATKKWDYSLRICDTGSFEIYGIEMDGDKNFDAVYDNFEDAVNEIAGMIDI